MAKDQADLLFRYLALPQFASHAMPDRIRRHTPVQARLLAKKGPSSIYRLDGLSGKRHVTLRGIGHSFEPRQKSGRDRQDRSVFLVLTPAGWIEVYPVVRLIKLRRSQLENCGRSCKRIPSDNQISKHLTRLRGIHEQRDFGGHDGSS